MVKGDKVRIKCGISYPQNGEYYVSQNVSIGVEYILGEYLISKANGKYWSLTRNGLDVSFGMWAFEFQMELVEANQNNFNSMDIKEKFLTSLKKEPEKSFRKAGLTNGDDMLTQDGIDIFLNWLLQKHGNDFKKEVVDEMLDLQKKEEEKK